MLFKPEERIGSGHEKRVVLFHQGNALVVEENAMLDGVNPGADGVFNRNSRVRMSRYFAPQPMRLGNQGLHFFRAVLLKQGIVAF